MNRFVKIIVCLMLVAGGLIGSQRKASAQFVVEDPGNLVQSILQYIQDQIREGSFDFSGGLSKLEGMREQFKAASDKLDQAMGVVQKFSKYGSVMGDVRAVGYIFNRVSRDIIMFSDIEYYMSNLGTYQSVALTGNLIKSYSKMTDNLIASVKSEVFDISKLIQADPAAISAEFRKIVEYLYSGYQIIRDYFVNAYRSAYFEALGNRARQMDDRLLSRFMY